VTGDGLAEALVVVGNICDCSGESHGVYVYRLREATPALLWAFSTGDRANGGLRNVYAHAGRLVVETYGQGSGPDRLPPHFYEPVCCGQDFSRRTFEWRGKRFRQRGRTITVDIPREARSN
jgi:hypothetical protein